MPPSRITQKDIALAAGVTQATVSLALHDQPGVKASTVALVRSIAERLGYTPDPYLTHLSSYRHRLRPPQVRATLAWLSNDATGSVWKKSRTFSAYHEGARLRAAELGYQLEDHCLRSPCMTPRRMEQILHARGISGILAAPQPSTNIRLDFNFTRFSSVALGYTLVEPRLHLVTWHQFRAMKTAFRELLALGYRRPGLALNLVSDARSDHNWSAAFLNEQTRLASAQRLPPLLVECLDSPQLLRWVGAHKPDVVIAIRPEVHRWLLDADFAIPRDIGFAALSVPEGDTTLSGLSENPRAIGSSAVDFLVDMIHRSERGVPAMQICHLTEGHWCPGTTLRYPARLT